MIFFLGEKLGKKNPVIWFSIFVLAHRDVPQLVKMIGPEPSKFAGMSPRIDEFVQSITAKLARVPSF